ncbi:MAG: polysaccharide biosynthesis tyrosine autokinase [Candidatus Omnitrophica bacterium]|nr:polysaccharide biosynthesis tyrosine autokinase [Candidatus Omnitrophota bacterium]
MNNLSFVSPASAKLALTDYWYVFQKRKRVILSFFLIAFFSTAFYTLISPRVYKATTQVLIEQGNKNVLSFQDVFSVDMGGQEYYATQHKIIKSRSVGRKVIAKLGLGPRYKGIDPVGSFLSQIDVSPVKGSRLVDVSFYYGNPKEAAHIVDTVVKTYIEQNFENKANITRQASEWLEKEIVNAREKLTESELALQRFKENNKSIDFTELETSENLLNKLQLDLSNLKNDLSALNQRYLPKHPKIIRAKSRIDALKKQVEEETKDHIALGRVSIEFNQLKREVDSNRKIYETMLSRLKETVITKDLEDTNVIVIDPAEVPKTPVLPRKFFNLLLGLFIGIFGGCGLALVFENLDSSIKSKEDVERITETPMLGMIYNWKSEQSEMIVHEDKFASVSEAFRAIRTALLFSSPDKPLRTLMVSSPNPKEGKTLIACNLAVAIAQSGARVVLVDADMRRPRIHKVFRLKNVQGLSNVLTHTVNPAEFIVKTEVENLSVLLCGPIPPTPSELLGSKRMAQLIEQLRELYDYVVFDSPPFLSVTDPVVLSTQVDGAIIVTRYNKTHRDALLRGIHSFMDVKANLAGIIINDMNFEQERYRNSSYSYYYGRYTVNEDIQAAAIRNSSKDPAQSALTSSQKKDPSLSETKQSF